MLWNGSEVQDLGADASAHGINDHGQVVGQSGGSYARTDDAHVYGVVWIDGIIYKLQDLIAKGAPSGTTLVNAAAINESGQILVNGGDGNIENDALILTPSDIAPTVSAPTFSLPPRTYASSQSVALTDSTPAAKIYYTLDGTVPTSQSQVYNAPLTLRHSPN